jgi:hypothetical protein
MLHHKPSCAPCARPRRGTLLVAEERGDRTGRGAVHHDGRRAERPETGIPLGIDEIRPGRVVRELLGGPELGAERNRAHVDPAQGLQPAGRHGGHHANPRAMRRSQQDRANRAFAVQRHGLGDVVDDQIHRLVAGDEFENPFAVQIQGFGLARFPQRVAGPLMSGLQLHRLGAQSEGLRPDALAQKSRPSQGGDRPAARLPPGWGPPGPPSATAAGPGFRRPPETAAAAGTCAAGSGRGIAPLPPSRSRSNAGACRAPRLRRCAAGQMRGEDHVAGRDRQNLLRRLLQAVDEFTLDLHQLTVKFAFHGVLGGDGHGQGRRAGLQSLHAGRHAMPGRTRRFAESPPRPPDRRRPIPLPRDPGPSRRRSHRGPRWTRTD